MYLRDQRRRRRKTGRVIEIFEKSKARRVAAFVLISMSIIGWADVVSRGVMRPYISFFLTVVPISVAISLLLGWGRGLLTAGIMHVLGLYFILPPQNSFTFADEAEIVYFVLTGVGTLCLVRMLSTSTAGANFP